MGLAYGCSEYNDMGSGRFLGAYLSSEQSRMLRLCNVAERLAYSAKVF